jgi:hypothetical protein
VIRTDILTYLTEGKGIAQLPKRLTPKLAREKRAEYIKSLSPAQLRIFKWLGEKKGDVFGDRKGGPGLLTPKRSRDRRRKAPESERIDDLSTVAKEMLAAGWLRFHPGPDGKNGHYWLTDSAERLWKMLHEKAAAGLL